VTLEILSCLRVVNELRVVYARGTRASGTSGGYVWVKVDSGDRSGVESIMLPFEVRAELRVDGPCVG